MATALWALANGLQLTLIVGWSVVCITAALAARLLTGGRRTPLAMARLLWAPVVLRVAGARLTVDGNEGPARQPLAGGAVVVANHASLVDVPALFAALPVPLYFVAKSELRGVPFLGWYIAAMGMVFVERRQPGQAARVADQALERLREGGVVVFFPEGTRAAGERLGRFRSGAFLTAVRAGVPVVPVAVAGTRRVMPARGWRLRPGPVRVRVGAPLASAGLRQEEGRELAERARAAVAALLAEAQSGGGPA